MIAFAHANDPSKAGGVGCRPPTEQARRRGRSSGEEARATSPGARGPQSARAPRPSQGASGTSPRPLETAGPRPGRAAESLAGLCALAAWAARATGAAAALSAAAGMMLLGPFGFFPALAVAPAVFLADALDGLAERLAAGAQAEVPPPRGRTPSQAPGPSPAQVAFHRALPEVLARFAACEDSVCRREEAALLGEALSEHFALEEASGGFLADLVERAPELHESVRALEEEHGALLEALAPFAAEDPGVARPDRGSALRWVQRVQDHQRREDTLFERAYGVLLDGAAEA